MLIQEIFGVGFGKASWKEIIGRRSASPTPEAVTIGAIDAHYAACITRRLPGITVQDSDVSTLQRLTGPVSTVLARIGAVDLSGTHGYGPFDETVRGRHPSWRDLLATAHPQARGLTNLTIETDLVRPLLSAQQRLVNACPEQRQLVHGDFGSNNLLTDGHRITGVLDWANAMLATRSTT